MTADRRKNDGAAGRLLAIRKTRLRSRCARRFGADSDRGKQTVSRRAAVSKGMKRYVFTILMLTVFVLLVAGCGGGNY